MKKKNIVRFTAFILAVLMCLTCTATLFAENVDATEVSSETETKEESKEATEETKEESKETAETHEDNETEAVSETETQTVSSNNAQPTRSELGQKILDFKNPDKYRGAKLFKGTIYNDDATAINENESFVSYIGDENVKVGIYDKTTDTIKYCGSLKLVSAEDNTIDGTNFYKSSIKDASIKSISTDTYIGLTPETAYTVTKIPSNYKDLYFCFFGTDVIEDSEAVNNLLFVTSVEDSVHYVKSRDEEIEDGKVPEFENKSTMSVSSKPVIEDDGSVYNVDVVFDFEIIDTLNYASPDFDNFFDGWDVERTNKATSLVIKKDDHVVKIQSLTKDAIDGIKKGSVTVSLNNGNGIYTYELYTCLSGLGNASTNLVGSFELTSFKSANTEVTENDLAKATVNFSGQPNEAYDGDSVTFQMNTDKKCKMEFNGVVLANDEYATSSDVSITSNGTYHYIAITEQGVKTEGDLEINFFKERGNTQVSDPLDTDLVSAKTDESLSQTGIYQIWLIILAVVFCGIGIALILNQKYHFLDNIVRRLKHESN